MLISTSDKCFKRGMIMKCPEQTFRKRKRKSAVYEHESRNPRARLASMLFPKSRPFFEMYNNIGISYNKYVRVRFGVARGWPRTRGTYSYLVRSWKFQDEITKLMESRVGTKLIKSLD